MSATGVASRGGDANPASFGLGRGLPTLDELRAAVAARLVSERTLVTQSGLTYRLFNYTPRANFARAWDAATLAARGLIVCDQTGEVVAAPFGKFMNLGEPLGDGRVADVREGPFEALVKLDGSLGILYRADDAVRWATRGSFASDQARVAQEMWDRRYREHDRLLLDDPAWGRLTLLAEIIHPETRVVCRYDFEDLILIGARDRFTGEDLPHERLVEVGARLGMPVVERVDADVESLLARAATLDDNQEGFVLRWADGYRLKIKGAAYKQLHRVLSNLTPQRLAQEWYEGRLADVVLLMPEEFRAEAEAVAAELEGRLVESVREVGALFAASPRDAGQRAFAAWVREAAPRPLHGLLYRRRQLDAGDPTMATKLVEGVLVGLLRSGRLVDMLDGEAYGDLRPVIERAEAEVAAMLWEGTRDRAALQQVRTWAGRLPNDLRGAAVAAIEDLRPDAVIEKARAFVARPDVREQAGEVDVDVLFGSAPPVDASPERHMAWVFTQPPQLRPYLDRWREAGRRDTATVGARKLLALAWAGDSLDALLGDPARAEPTVGELVVAEPAASKSAVDEAGVAVAGGGLSDSASVDGERAATAIRAGLAGLAEYLGALWRAIPTDDDPDAVAGWLTARPADERAWADALVQESWSGHRDRALKEFLAAHAGEQGRAARLVEDA